MSKDDYYSKRRVQSEPGIIKLIKWAFSNPEKVAAVGFGIAAFGLAAFFLESHKENSTIARKDDESAAIGSRVK